MLVELAVPKRLGREVKSEKLGKNGDRGLASRKASSLNQSCGKRHRNPYQSYYYRS